MSKGKNDETTFAGLMEAVTDGQVSADELLEQIELHPEWLAECPMADAAMDTYKKMVKTGKLPMGKKKPKKDDEEDKKEAIQPESALVTDQGIAIAGSTFESLVDEACSNLKKMKKKRKGKQKESIHEFAAPERQDVIYWARGQAPKRTEPKNPFFFKESQMFSRKRLIAERNLEEKTAKVLHPNRLDASSGRHAVLAQKGLRYAGYKVEFVNEL